MKIFIVIIVSVLFLFLAVGSIINNDKSIDIIKSSTSIAVKNMKIGAELTYDKSKKVMEVIVEK